GRGVPPKPGWVGAMTLTFSVSASRSANPLTESGPAPPWRITNGRPPPRSVKVRSTSPIRSTVRDRVVVVVAVVMRGLLYLCVLGLAAYCNGWERVHDLMG